MFRKIWARGPLRVLFPGYFLIENNTQLPDLCMKTCLNYILDFCFFVSPNVQRAFNGPGWNSTVLLKTIPFNLCFKSCFSKLSSRFWWLILVISMCQHMRSCPMRSKGKTMTCMVLNREIQGLKMVGLDMGQVTSILSSLHT